MPIIRVGFILPSNTWLGGINYYRNLFRSVHLASSKTIHLVLFTGMKCDVEAYQGLVEIIRTPLVDRYSFSWCFRQFFKRIIPRRDYLLYWLLKSHDIKIISHADQLWRNCPIPNIKWIPDFQHIHLPDFFGKHMCRERDRHYMDCIRHSNAILLSSQDALNDLSNFSPQHSTRTYILRFVTYLDPIAYDTHCSEAVKALYKIDRAWFHVPNQFWAHKNHSVIIKALIYLKQHGHEFLVISTGETNDSRNPAFFQALKNTIQSQCLDDNFRILGILPYPHVLTLMKDSIAVINPSLFEGWSTTVEESKALGKKLILSDIPVHREQNPERGFYFGPHDYIALAHTLIDVTKNHNLRDEKIYRARAKSQNITQVLSFAKQYEEIICEVLNDASHHAT